MNHRDAEMAEVTIILDRAFEERMVEALDLLKKAGLDVTDADDDRNVVEGTCEIAVIERLRGMELVEYVRVGITWIADYPPGDPRDKDGPDEE